ncbi:DUF2863 family protein [Massilia sp. H-1]|nr:DUF2863 family protein [Massilia sp. H-1]
MRQATDVIYGIVWPLYGQEDEDGTPVEGLVNARRRPERPEGAARRNRRAPERCGRHPCQTSQQERFAAEYCDDCGGPLFADPVGELVHAEMPDDAPA